MVNKAIVLSRVSTQYQDLSQQTNEVLREVYKDGYREKNIIIIEDVESAIKLSEEERHGLNKMKDYINRDSSIKCVYIYELSRLSRRQLVLFSIRDFLADRKIQLICLKPYFRLLEIDGSISQTGSLMFSLFSSLSESEMILKKERMMRGRRRNKELGKASGGKPPYGYKIDANKKFVVHSSQADILNRIFNDYAYDSKTMHTIAVELKEEGYFPELSIPALRLKINAILNRKTYLGEFPYPQIISNELYLAAQNAITEHRAIHPPLGVSPFLLKGLVCDACTGYLLSSNRAANTYFSKNHSGVTIKRTNIDPVVWEYSKMMYERYIMNHSLLMAQIKKSYDTTAKKIATIKKDMRDINIKLEKVEESYILGRIRRKKADALRTHLQEELTLKKHRHSELIDIFIKKQAQKNSLILDTINESLLTIEEKLNIIRKVVDVVTVEKPNKTFSHIRIYNRINSLVNVYEVHCWKHTWRLLRESNTSKDPYPQIKSKHIKTQNILI